ncbi:hypothetical protein [Vibrio vulnificus]|uniref:hypothetical protein n=1 Tax=Vibrio vulnificus TaxID=672 RepID=UPI0013792E71|nr:hypothetical protein [Vibrio vulnificus]
MSNREIHVRRCHGSVNLPRIKFLLEAVSKLLIQRASVNVEVIEPVNIGKKG